MSPLAERVRAEILEQRLLGAGDRLVIALSGGPDSVTLTHLLVELAASGDLVLAGLAHLNHRMRHTASDEDERFCRAMAARLSLPIEVGSVDVPCLARKAGQSLEVAAREARYGFLAQAAERLDATRIAVGHTLDDQAETYLLKLLRGAGPRGLAGIHPRKGAVIRPILSISRSEVLAYLAERGLEFRQDETNLDRDIPRNLVRHELIPWLREHVNPSVTGALARGAVVAREDAEWLERTAQEAASRVLRGSPNGIEIDAACLTAEPPAVARRIARLALSRVAPDRFISFSHVAEVLRLAGAPKSDSVDLPGQRATRVGPAVLLSPRRGRTAPTAGVSGIRQALAMPGEASIASLGVVIAAEPAPLAPPWTMSSAPDTAVVSADATRLPLAVRTRRTGDAFRPLGLGRRRKLQDFLVDRKVPKCERDSVLLVVDADDHIIWVVGWMLAHDFRVTESTRGVIILTFRELGGAG